MALDDGRYLDRGDSGPRVLVIETEGGSPPVRRKRRRPRDADPGRSPVAVPVTVVTVVFADRPMDEPTAAEWLREGAVEPRIEDLIDTALLVLDRGLAAACVTTGRAIGEPIGPERTLAVRIGYGEGERVYDGRFSEALEVDSVAGGSGARQARLERIVPLGRIAAIIGGREPIHACEVMVPRIRADLDGDRLAPAVLALPEAVRATISELEFLLEDPDHERDLDRLEEILPELMHLPDRLLGDGMPPVGSPGQAELESTARAALEVAERAIRRYRISTQ